MLSVKNTRVVALSPEQAQKYLQGYGFGVSLFDDGAVFRVWAACPVTGVQLYDRATRSYKDPDNPDLVQNVLVMTPDGGGCPEEWDERDDAYLHHLVTPKLEGCQLYALQGLVLPRKGFKMVPDATWRPGFYEKGIMSPSHIPDAIECYQNIPASIMDLIKKPQFVCPRDWFDDDKDGKPVGGLGASLFRKNFKKFEWSGGSLVVEENDHKLSIIDYEVLINEMIANSPWTAKDPRGVEHHYLKVQVQNSKDQYRVYRRQLWDPQVLRTLQIIDK